MTSVEGSKIHFQHLRQVGTALVCIQAISIDAKSRSDNEDTYSIYSEDLSSMGDKAGEIEDADNTGKSCETVSPAADSFHVNLEASKSGQPQSSTPSTKQNYGRTRREQDEDEDDGPPRKRARTRGEADGSSDRRFACPYQVYEPVAGAQCCRPGPNNGQKGGCDGIGRVK